MIIKTMETITLHQKKDIKLIGKFVEVYCSGKHSKAQLSSIALPEGMGVHQLCPECASFLEYAISKRLKCPLEAVKPKCKHCQIHCYDRPNREKVREIMSYSGRKLLIRGRLDYLWHYFF